MQADLVTMRQTCDAPTRVKALQGWRAISMIARSWLRSPQRRREQLLVPALHGNRVEQTGLA